MLKPSHAKHAPRQSLGALQLCTTYNTLQKSVYQFLRAFLVRLKERTTLAAVLRTFKICMMVLRISSYLHSGGFTHRQGHRQSVLGLRYLTDKDSLSIRNQHKNFHRNHNFATKLVPCCLVLHIFLRCPMSDLTHQLGARVASHGRCRPQSPILSAIVPPYNSGFWM
eukprot:jgi/Botrbrau1/21477/Bobra.0216s0085.1